MSIISIFKNREKKYNLFRGKDGMNMFCESLREHAMKKIHFKKKRNEIIDKRTAKTT